MIRRTRWIALSLLMMGCGGGGATAPGGTTSNPGSPGTTATASGMISVKSSSDSYGTASFSFNPSDLTLVKGGTVTWSNNTGVVHSVVFGATSGAPANVADFSSGSVTRTFAATGAYDFHCSHHPEMTGTITVQ